MPRSAIWTNHTEDITSAIEHPAVMEVCKHLESQGYKITCLPGTENVIHILALGKACEIAKRDFDRNFQTMLMSRDRLIDGLKSKLGDEFEINGDLSRYYGTPDHNSSRKKDDLEQIRPDDSFSREA